MCALLNYIILLQSCVGETHLLPLTYSSTSDSSKKICVVFCKRLSFSVYLRIANKPHTVPCDCEKCPYSDRRRTLESPYTEYALWTRARLVGHRSPLGRSQRSAWPPRKTKLGMRDWDKPSREERGEKKEQEEYGGEREAE
jgi:hypothetical protein